MKHSWEIFDSKWFKQKQAEHYVNDEKARNIKSAEVMEKAAKMLEEHGTRECNSAAMELRQKSHNLRNYTPYHRDLE